MVFKVKKKRQVLYVGLVTILVIVILFIAKWNAGVQAPERRPEFEYHSGRVFPGEDREKLAKLRLSRLRSGMRTRELNFVKTLPKRNEQTDEQTVWEARGPHHVGGRTRALAIDVENPRVIFAGGVTGGLWRSHDGGASWTKVTRSDQVQSVTCIRQDTRVGQTDTWYYGTGERIGTPPPGLPGDGVFKSTDGGLNWNQLPSTSAEMPQDFSLGFNFCWNIAVDGSNATEDEVYVAGDGALYRSVDGGGTWEKVLNGAFFQEAYGLWDEVPTDVAVSPTGVVYATFAVPLLGGETQTQGVWRSPDGTNWTRITAPGWPAEFYRTVVAISPADENTVYFLASTPRFDDYRLWKYTYLSGDGSGAGGSWQDLSANLSSDLVGQFSYDMLLAIRPDDANVIYVGGINLTRSSDGFATAQNTALISDDDFVGLPGNPGLHVDQHALVFSPTDPDTVYIANDGGVFRSTHELAGQNRWTSLNNGYVTTQFYCVSLDQATSGSDALMGGTQDNGTWFTNSSDPNLPWTEILPGDGISCAVADGGAFYYLWSSFRDNPNGRGIWQAEIAATGEVAALTAISPTQDLFTFSLFRLDPNDTNIMYSSGIRRDTGFGVQYILRHDQLEQSSEEGWMALENTRVEAGISAIGVSTQSPSHRIYYSIGDFRGTDPFRLFRLDAAHSGQPDVVEITGANFPQNDFNLTVSQIAVDPTDGEKVLVVFNGYEIPSLFYSDDTGQSWSDVSGNLEEFPDGSGSGPSMSAAAILPLANGETFYFVGGSAGLFSTTTLNGAQTIWMQEGVESIGTTPVLDIAARSSDGFVAIATHGNGVFSAVIDPTVSVDEPVAIPEQIALHQNYPNPFNPSTTIRYGLPGPSTVRLTIYNLRGQKVRTLIAGEKRGAGIHTIQWDATSDTGLPVASGTYIYRLRAGNSEQSRKMTLVR